MTIPAMTNLGSQFGSGGTGLTNGILRAAILELQTRVRAVEAVAGADAVFTQAVADIAAAADAIEVLQAQAAKELTVVVAAGATDNTDVTVTGLGAEDTVVACIVFNGGVPATLTKTAQTAGKLQFGVDTTDKAIVVIFYKTPLGD